MKDRYWLGEWRAGGPLDARAAAELCRDAQARRAAFAAYPIDRVLRLLGRVRQRWLDPGYGPRRRVERLLPDVTGFSPAMVRRGVSELCWTFDPELLHKKLDTELRGIDGSGALRWEPVGVTLHVLAGNVFVGAAGSLVEGLITRNVSLLKMSSAETVFLPELVRSIRELDDDGVVSRSIAVFEYGSSRKDVMAELQRGVDAIAVWGGEAAVRGYRDGLPARTRLIVFGPKLSLALATRRGLAARGVEAAAERLAAEVSVWDQNACTAPQVCFVEGGPQARRLAVALGPALERAAKALPPGKIDTDAAVEIQKLRGVFEIAAARGEGEVWGSRRGLEWTVVLDRQVAIEPSPLQRTLRVVPVRRAEEVVDLLGPLRGYVQTVGLWSTPEEATLLGPKLTDAGALRVLELGRMAEGEIDDPHDGAYDLPQFHHLVLDRGPRPGPGHPFEFWPEARRRAWVDARLRTLLDAARRSPFYGRRLRGLNVEGAGDLVSVPILTREEMDRNMPPKSQGLSTGPWTGGCVTRSGGSTGTPKFSVYDGRDWDAMIGHGAGVFEALGLERADRVANFMIPGDLYGSFVSFDHINTRLGAACFNFAGASTPEVFVDIWRGFGLNAAEGIPAQLIPFLRRAKALEPRLALEKVIYAGSPLGATDAAWLREALKVRRIASVIGANDGGQLAYQCDAQRGSLHHTVDDFNYLEVVDASGRPVPDGETGLLVITSLLKLAYPLIRYAVGDLGRIVLGRCPCGRTSRVVEHLGRSDDALCVGMMNVRYRDISAALDGLPVSTLQLAARSGEAGESLVLRVETERPSDALRRKVQERLLRASPKVASCLKTGELAGLDVELFEPGGLPRNARTGKVRGLVDERG